MLYYDVLKLSLLVLWCNYANSQISTNRTAYLVPRSQVGDVDSRRGGQEYEKSDHYKRRNVSVPTQLSILF
jgi:hypothetical protein